MRGVSTVMLLVPCLVMCGCGNQGGASAQSGKADGNVQAVADAGESHDHNGWWCVEHGVPEDICAQCNSKLAAEFQKKGDWCKAHNRPESQCFVCHPELEEKFAAQYEAKFGSPPPKPTE